MKQNRLLITTSCCLLAIVLLGCATVKEMGKGFAGMSTKVLEAKRKDSLKKSFVLGYASCYEEVKKLLTGKEKRSENVSCIYAEDKNKKMIAFYLSSTDTTPVGIFFTEEAKNKTLIEVASPSNYAKEIIAKNIFSGLDALINPKPRGGQN